jgi:hypothetical protein
MLLSIKSLSHGDPGSRIYDTMATVSPSAALRERGLELIRTLNRCQFAPREVCSASATTIVREWKQRLNLAVSNTSATLGLAKLVANAVDKLKSGEFDRQTAIASLDLSQFGELERSVRGRSEHFDKLFSAVSWYRGNPSFTEKMRVNGTVFKAPANAVHALRHVRDRNETAVLWIDAICINQQDHVERESQILLMRDIYSSASKANIWLGHDDGDTGATMTALRSMASFTKKRQVYGKQKVLGEMHEYS